LINTSYWYINQNHKIKNLNTNKKILDSRQIAVNFWFNGSIFFLKTELELNLISLRRQNFTKNNFTRPFYFTKWYYKDKTNHNLFVRMLMRSGLKIKYVNLYSSIFLYFYKNFFFFNKQFSEMFPLYNTFFNLKKNNAIFYLIDFFYEFIFENNQSMFFVKVCSVPKKLKKKEKKKYILFYSYLHPKNRKKWILKQIKLSTSFFNYKEFRVRLYFAWINVLLNPNSNSLKAQHLKVYKNILAAKGDAKL
jgi:hypothetical protein